jgi:hypothetical protein
MHVVGSATAIVFTVATHKPDHGYGIGKLFVSGDAISLETWPVARGLVTHTSGPVTIVSARCALPRWRAALVLRGPEGSYEAELSRRQAHRVRLAIAGAGFEVRERETRLGRWPRSSF